MAYNLLDLTTSVQDDLKDPSFSSTRIARYLNHGQKVIFNTHLFKFCETEYPGTLTIGDYTAAQQTDHQGTISITLVDPLNNGRYVILDDKNYLVHREFFERYPNASASSPQMPYEWTEFGNLIYFNCPVDKAYIFRQKYYRTPTDMVSTTDAPDVPESQRELLEMWANYRAEKYRGNHDVAATYKQEFEDELEAMNIRFASVIQNGPVVMGSARRRIQ